MKVCAESAFHAQTGDPQNRNICPHETGNVCLLSKTVLSLLTLCLNFKKVMHRVWVAAKQEGKSKKEKGKSESQ